MLILLLSLQFLDHMNDHKASRRRLEYKRQTVMQKPDDTLYDIASKNALICESSIKTFPNFLLISYAALHNVPTTNCGGIARLIILNGFDFATFENGVYDRNAVYVITSDDLWNAVKAASDSNEIREDGSYRLYVPKNR
jgi:hypothetical protein